MTRIEHTLLFTAICFCATLHAQESDKPLLGRPVPERSRAPEVLHLADVLYTSGRRAEALRLWKSVVAMERFGAGVPPGFLRRAAREATRRRNLYAKERSEFARVDLETDPYPFFDDGQTTVVSDRFGFRVRLPGAYLWRALPHPAPDRGTALTLARGKLSLFLGAETLRQSLNLEEYVLLWDDRRALNPQRKLRLRFKRRLHGDNDSFCVERDVCSYFQASLNDRGTVAWLEYYRIHGNTAFFMKLNHAAGSEPEARALLQSALANLRFRSGG